MRLWPWGRKTEEEPAVHPVDEDQTARLRAAKAAVVRTNELLDKARDQVGQVEQHLREMHKVRSDNHLTDLIRNYAFREK